VLCNACHEIKPEDLPRLLARLLRDHLKRSPSARLVIHELEVLVTGEAGYIMWNPEDYERLFAPISAFEVQARSFTRPNSVPLNTTIVSWARTTDPLDGLEDRLRKGFAEQLPAKRMARLAEYAELHQRVEQKGFQEAVRQRRVAFVTAEIAALVAAEERGAFR
jgi:hypothetical protein